MDKTLIKQQVKVLIDKYQKLKEQGKINNYTEEETKNVFIRPLFEFLGWDFSEKEEVSAEEHIFSSGRVDYGFYLNGRVQFYLEAKALKADLNNEEYAKQAIRYSFNKGVTWAVLTDFESIKVFNAQGLSKYLGDKLYFEIKYLDYIDKFDKLWELSKESFREGIIDKKAEELGKKLQKVPITDLLFKDLNECRKILTHSLGQYNPKVQKDLLDEGVQKLLDRLLFIRVAEDRKIEQNILVPLINQWRTLTGSNKPELYESMAHKFRELDEIYNSNLFSPHPFEKWEDDGGALEQVIKLLHGKEGYYEYDFSVMPADVLGSVYENYLGYKLSQSKKGLTLDKSAGKRKEQGIYYTPTFIVDYIVRNALKPVLDKCVSVNDLKKIKVLDPACGSGSFLIKALEVILEKYKEFTYEDNENLRVQIILENLYGVDLDEQAVEIARLNLLVSALKQKGKLPSLDKNIKNGNSLISGTDEELEKYFGKNFRDKKPFNWQEEFLEVFKQGGFNLIIGNPPYIRNRELNIQDKKFFGKVFKTASGQYDIYQLFFENSINILKNNGVLGFITSNKYTITDYGKRLREFILNNCKIISILDVSNLQVFKDASIYPYVIILENNSNNAENMIKGYKTINETNLEQNPTFISQDKIKNSSTKNLTIKTENGLIKRIETNSVKLSELASIKETIHTGNIREKLITDKNLDEKCKKLLAGKDCHRYWFKWDGKYVRYDKTLIDRSKNEYANLIEQKYFDNPKILLREIARKIECCFDDQGYYTLNKVYSIQSNSKYNLQYIISLLNSKLLSYYFSERFKEAHVGGEYLQFKKLYTSQLPIRVIDFSNSLEKNNYDKLVKLAKEMFKLKKELLIVEENSNKWNLIKEETEEADKKIDEEVYKLYGLTPEEIAIVEKNNI